MSLSNGGHEREEEEHITQNGNGDIVEDVTAGDNNVKENGTDTGNGDEHIESDEEVCH